VGAATWQPTFLKHPDADQPPEPHLYLSHAQSPSGVMSLVARTGSDAAATTAAVRQAIWNIDDNQPIDEVRTMGQVLYDDFSGDISVVGLVASFGLVALLLATAGVYGVISYSVSRRDREIGIRMALGAGRPNVLAMVVRQGLAPVVVGLSLGLAGGFVASRICRRSSRRASECAKRVLPEWALKFVVARARSRYPMPVSGIVVHGCRPSRRVF